VFFKESFVTVNMIRTPLKNRGRWREIDIDRWIERGRDKIESREREREVRKKKVTNNNRDIIYRPKCKIGSETK